MILWPSTAGRPLARALAALCLAVLLLAVGSPAAWAAVSISSGTQPQPSPSYQDAVHSQITAATDKLAGLTADLQALVRQLQAANDELKAIVAAKPRAPGQKATDSDKRQYQKALNAWQTRIDAAQSRIAALRNQIEQKMREIETCKAELQNLLNNVLPQAREKDRAALERKIKEAREAAQDALDKARAALAAG